MSSEQTLPRIGVIGLGNAGSAMTEALSAHYTVHVYDRDPACLSGLSGLSGRTLKPPIICATAADLARQVEFLILSLPTPEASVSVAEEIKASIKPDTTIVESSTVGVDDVQALQRLLSTTGARVIDVPLVGGVQKLAQGKAVFLAGVTEADAGIVATVFGTIADKVYFLGALGNGMRTKLIVNSVAHVVYVALVESSALAAVQGIPLPVLHSLLARESGLIRPLAHRLGERMLNHDFVGGMPTANARKDSALILDVAREFGVPVFATSAAHSVYELALHEGLERLDYASIGTLWEKWLGVSLGGSAPEQRR